MLTRSLKSILQVGEGIKKNYGKLVLKRAIWSCNWGKIN